MARTCSPRSRSCQANLRKRNDSCSIPESCFWLDEINSFYLLFWNITFISAFPKYDIRRRGENKWRNTWRFFLNLNRFIRHRSNNNSLVWKYKSVDSTSRFFNEEEVSFQRSTGQESSSIKTSRQKGERHHRSQPLLSDKITKWQLRRTTPKRRDSTRLEISYPPSSIVQSRRKRREPGENRVFIILICHVQIEINRTVRQQV